MGALFFVPLAWYDSHTEIGHFSAPLNPVWFAGEDRAVSAFAMQVIRAPVWACVRSRVRAYARTCAYYLSLKGHYLSLKSPHLSLKHHHLLPNLHIFRFRFVRKKKYVGTFKFLGQMALIRERFLIFIVFPVWNAHKPKFPPTHKHFTWLFPCNLRPFGLNFCKNVFLH